MDNANLRTTFNADAERYHASRPHYPEELFRKLITGTRLTPAAKVLAIGPGTGQAQLVSDKKDTREDKTLENN